jgi:uncharacterized protein YndB with AHSA1/START domain
MAALVSTIEVARTPKEVFEYATDPARFPEWQRDVVRVQVLDETRFSTTRRISRTERSMTQEITHNEPPYRWGAQGIDGPVRPHATITIEPLEGGARSRVTFTLDFEGHGLGVPLIALVRRQARAGAPVSYRNLQRILEAP